ncbi:MAG: flagellar brake protein [Gallionellaceae bacterium]|jgi:hypothetical protein
MSLILVNRNELTVGKSPPWPVMDSDGNPLLAQGELVRDDTHLKTLLASGACHEMSWEGSNGSDTEVSLRASTEPAETDSDNKGFTFDDLKLKVEDRLLLEPPAKLGSDRLPVKVIGFLKGQSLLVTTPMATSGQRLQLLENETVIIRSFSGQNAFAFSSSVMRICRLPYEYLHLSFPVNIQGLAIRKAPRVKTRIIVSVQSLKPGSGEQISALICDISAKGLSLDAKRQLGEKGDTLSLAFRLQLHKIEALLSIKGIIRSISNIDAVNDTKPALIRYGIELQNLQPNDSVVLQSMIYQQMIENPHNLI